MKPIRILDSQVKQFSGINIHMVKVLWDLTYGDCNWEIEEETQTSYPNLFIGNLIIWLWLMRKEIEFYMNDYSNVFFYLYFRMLEFYFENLPLHMFVYVWTRMIVLCTRAYVCTSTGGTLEKDWRALFSFTPFCTKIVYFFGITNVTLKLIHFIFEILCGLWLE